MSNGSTRPSEESLLEQARRRSRLRGVLVACSLASIAGCFHATLQKAPDLQDELTTLTAEDFFVLGVSHARAGDLLRAEQYLSVARQRNHDEAAVVYWLVRVCVAASRYQSAVGHAADYLRDHPANWSLRLVVASLYEALGDVSRAQEELERIVDAEPERPLPHYRLAMLYRSTDADVGRWSNHLEEYIRLSPNGPHAPEVRSALSEIAEASLGPEPLAHSVEHEARIEATP